MNEYFLLSVVVWGKKYLDLFLKVGLPSALAPGNLPALASEARVVLCLITDRDGLHYLADHSEFTNLTELIKVQVICMNMADADPFNNLQKAHILSIKHANKIGAAIIFLGPDFVMADGTLHRLLELKKKGFGAVHVLTPRLKAEEARPALEARKGEKTSGAIQLEPREMVRLGLEHLHPIEKSYYWGKDKASFPIHVYWDVDKSGFIAHCFYLHPIMVCPRVKGVLPKGTIDADFPDLCCPNIQDNYVVTDSDDIACFELTGKEVKDTNSLCRPYFKRTFLNLGKWAAINANPCSDSNLHHWMFQKTILIHCDNLNQRWEKEARKARRFVEKVRWIASCLCYKRRISPFRYLAETETTYHNLLDNINEKKTHSIRFEGYIWNFLNCLLIKKFILPNYEYKSNWTAVDKTGINEEVGCWTNGRSELLIPVPKIKPHSVRLKASIEACDWGSVDRLHVEVKGLPAFQQSTNRADGRYWHCCMIPAKYIQNTKFVKVDYVDNGNKCIIGEIRYDNLYFMRSLDKLRYLKFKIKINFFDHAPASKLNIKSYRNNKDLFVEYFSVPWSANKWGYHLKLKLKKKGSGPASYPKLVAAGQPPLSQEIRTLGGNYYLEAFCPPDLIQKNISGMVLALTSYVNSPENVFRLSDLYYRIESPNIRQYIQSRLMHNWPELFGVISLDRYNTVIDINRLNLNEICYYLPSDNIKRDKLLINLKLDKRFKYIVRFVFRTESKYSLFASINKRSYLVPELSKKFNFIVNSWQMPSCYLNDSGINELEIINSYGGINQLAVNRLTYRPCFKKLCMLLVKKIISGCFVRVRCVLVDIWKSILKDH